MAPKIPSATSTYPAAPTGIAFLNPTTNNAHAPIDNSIGLFLLLLFIVLLLASGTGIFVWKLYIQTPVLARQRIQAEDKHAPRQLFLPSLHYADHSSSSSASTIDPKFASNAHSFQEKRPYLNYLRRILKKHTTTPIEDDNICTDKEGEFVLVEAPIPGGDVPCIIVSTCSPSLRPQEFPHSVSTDSLQVPSNRFYAPRPQPPPPELPHVRRPFSMVANIPRGNPELCPPSQVKFDSFNSHHHYGVRMDISALGFQSGEFACSSPPRRALGKENASSTMQNGRPSHTRSHSRSYHQKYVQILWGQGFFNSADVA